ncbi:MAG: Crp/Fnr family transcriptional regulator [Phocaeicola sp.]
MKKEDLALFASLPHVLKRYKKGEYIARQGDRVVHLYWLARGSVRTEMVSESGFALPIEDMEAPCPLAIAFLFSDQNRFPVDVIALEECELYITNRAAVEEEMRLNPEFLRRFLAFSANRMQYLSDRLKIFAQKGIKSKIAYYLLSREKEGEFHLDRTVAGLAEYFGVERPSLSRAFSELTNQGVLSLQAGKGKILDRTAFYRLLD